MGGGRRRRIKGFSDGARRRLWVKLKATEWPVPWRDLLFVTLTYPGDEGAAFVARDGRTVKRHLKALALRHLREWGVPLQAFWKLEFQKRGAPHLHLAAVPPHPDAVQYDDDVKARVLRAYRRWLSKAWWEIVGSGSPDHLKAGTNAEFFCSRDASWYFTGYVSGGKAEQHEVPEGFRDVGRFWGMIGKLKVYAGKAQITRDQAVLLIRTARRLKWSKQRRLAKARAQREGTPLMVRKRGVPKGRQALRKRRREKQMERRERAREFFEDPKRAQAAADERLLRRRRLRGAVVAGGDFARDLLYQIARVLGEAFARGITRHCCRQAPEGALRFRSGMWEHRGQFVGYQDGHEVDWVFSPGG